MLIAIYGYAHPFGEGKYYGAERVIWYLIQELKRNGHECVVFSVNGCNLPGFEVIGLPKPWEEDRDIHFEAMKRWEVENNRRFDYIHSYMSSGFLSREMREEYPYSLEPFMGFRRWSENLIAYSHRMNVDHGNNGTVIHYGIPLGQYSDVEDTSEDYLVWIGRMDPGKAPHVAIEVAKRAGKRLILMGPAYHYPYFVDNIWPHIDMDRVIWLRSVDDTTKRRVFLKAKGFLSTNWCGYHEMLGIVNLESLACGTPVIGFANKNEPSAINFRGGEIIDHQVHGFIVEYDNSTEGQNRCLDDAVEAVHDLEHISREDCRQRYLDKFTSEIMAKKHELFFNLVKENGKVTNVSLEV